MEHKTLFGGLFPTEVENLIMEFDPTRRKAWNKVTAQFKRNKKRLCKIQMLLTYSYSEYTNYPDGDYEHGDDGEVTIRTFRYYDPTTRQIVPEHELIKYGDGTVEIWHYPPRMGKVRGRAGDNLAILES